MNIPLSVFLQAATQATAAMLQEKLPAIGGANWWKERVVAKLSYQQQQRFKLDRISKLEEVDLAALLRVFDKNWYEISEKAGYPLAGRNLVYEIIEIRHRLAHQGSAEKHTDEDLYRDLDTLKRYFTMINAGKDVITKVEDQKKQVLARMTGSKTDPARSGSDSPTPSDQPIPRPPSKPATPPTPVPATARSSTRGVPLEILGPKARDSEAILRLLASKTFVGIDFGTSITTVSRVVIDKHTGSLTAEPIPIKQYDETGCCIEDHLVPSCIAWTGQSLLVGQGAARLKSEYEYGRNIWFSFKMRLGIDLGPQYYRSELSRAKNGPCVIEKPQHAAGVFFMYLREKVEAYIRERGLPSEIIYSVSVPAAFEANQRKDLCDALTGAGITLPAYGIIDEPNAAFISYLLDTLSTGAHIAESIKQRRLNILVFDFGAGTCDISILEVGAEKDRFISKNKAISQFHALGGDNIDRQIVREILLKQLFDQSKPAVEFTTRDLAEAIIPRLQQAAENLKIQCCKYISNNWTNFDCQPFISTDRKVTGSGLPPFRVRGCELRLDQPTMTYAEFFKALQPFIDPSVAETAVLYRDDDIVSIFEPIDNALGKADIDCEKLDMILFVGGSSSNPLVQSAIHDRFGRFVECVIPGDLRTPVSRGTAINAFLVNGLHCEVIKPITSETIYVITAGGGLHELLLAGTEMPSDEVFISDLVVQRDGQIKVELPICVSNEDKLLGTVDVSAMPGHPFKKGESITLSCHLDENKLLQVKAKVGTKMVVGSLLNPLSNESITPEESLMWLARQAVNISALEHGQRPAVDAMLAYAYACAEAEHHLEAAEAFEAVERLDPKRDFSSSICFHYARAKKDILSNKWAEVAYERQPSALSAFNLALSKRKNGDMAGFQTLMEESISRDSEFAAALEIYGHYLKEKGLPKGIAMIETAFEQFKSEFDEDTLDDDDYPRLFRVASTLGRKDVIDRINQRRKDKSIIDKMFNEANLAMSTRDHQAQT